MKNMNQFIGALWKKLILSCLICVLSACATGVINHAFSFDSIAESPGISVLSYRYGDSKIPSAQSEDNRRRRGFLNIHGDMLRGDSLYVKWLVETTGKVYEDSVDLKAVLPRDIKGHRIHFTVKGQQLFVYLITPERRPPDMPPNGPRQYDFLKVITLSSNYGREVSNEQ